MNGCGDEATGLAVKGPHSMTRLWPGMTTANAASMTDSVGAAQCAFIRRHLGQASASWDSGFPSAKDVCRRIDFVYKLMTDRDGKGKPDQTLDDARTAEKLGCFHCKRHFLKRVAQAPGQIFEKRGRTLPSKPREAHAPGAKPLNPPRVFSRWPPPWALLGAPLLSSPVKRTLAHFPRRRSAVQSTLR